MDPKPHFSETSACYLPMYCAILTYTSQDSALTMSETTGSLTQGQTKTASKPSSLPSTSPIHSTPSSSIAPPPSRL
ncbi:hypothetical protein Agabi119p4_8273 [Agaricus bisporus var. burnettii]|uniref:Uncharacterized protein n=1 Tax=Agaricus bisporus var. burnettii TaxID=192524 RepID=A0A8H7C6A8_AGABI|nr:hypothetical protein Agabi119p4_8273 [Agaricus bisporus var. burnettii]